MPDLNSVPSSPRALANTQQTSFQNAAPPTGLQPQNPPSPSVNILPSNQHAVNQSSSAPSPQLAAAQPALQQSQTQDEAGVGGGPGPMRHPRPMAWAEMHEVLEKEQEQVVNRLSRELALLREQQNASVVSNTSSNSATTSTQEPLVDASLLSGSGGFSIPTSRRHTRTSSSASHGLASFREARNNAARSSQPRPIPSRQSSTASQSRHNHSPSDQRTIEQVSHAHQQRTAAALSVPASSQPSTGPEQSAQAVRRLEEVVRSKSELEAVKIENDSLKERIRDLEAMLRKRRAELSNRARSDSESTAASINFTPAESSIASPRVVPLQRTDRERGMTMQSVASVAGSVGVGIPDEEVKVGESAASSIPDDASAQ